MSTAPSTASRLASLFLRARQEGRPVILDGGLGTELDDRGADTSPPLWSGRAPLAYPVLLLAIHREYVDAGADIIDTCTFRTTRRSFENAGEKEDEWRRAAREAVRLAREAAGDRAPVSGCVGPLEDCFRPDPAPTGDGARDEHLELCRQLADEGVDLIVLETFGTMGESLAAADAAREAGTPRAIPFGLSFTTLADGRLLSGEPLEGAVRGVCDLGAAFVCVNCIPPAHVTSALDILARASTVPYGAYANLGRPEPAQDWRGSAWLPPLEYARIAASWVARGASIVGGCCGSGPEHIRALSTAAWT
ncbi:MAG: homocysteine S-methyltransferase family protein [Deltaproteobacteria bacterium]|nr:homocysteine S-methyltransferase family protein [Deltaproteobacteria bacterium]